jgi:thymidine kinase
MSEVSFELIVGPMFSGKTTLLIERVAAAENSGLATAVIKPAVDGRGNLTELFAHNGRTYRADVFRDDREMLELSRNAQVIGLDEAQFLDGASVEALAELIERGAVVFATALDLDFRGQPFSSTRELERLASVITVLRGICSKCGAPATHSQRFLDGVPAPLDGPTILVGGGECYQPRCEACFLGDRNS